MFLISGLVEIKSIKSLIERCKTIAAKSRQKSAFANMIESYKYNIIHKPINVRWNYEIKMIRDILKIKNEDLTRILTEINCSSLILNKNEYKILNELCELLEPFEYITNLAEGEKYVTISMVIPSVFELINHLRSFQKKNISNSISPLATKLLEELKQRFNG